MNPWHWNHVDKRVKSWNCYLTKFRSGIHKFVVSNGTAGLSYVFALQSSVGNDCIWRIFFHCLHVSINSATRRQLNVLCVSLVKMVVYCQIRLQGYTPSWTWALLIYVHHVQAVLIAHKTNGTKKRNSQGCFSLHFQIRAHC